MYRRQAYYLCFILIFIPHLISGQKSEKQLESYYPCGDDADCRAKNEHSFCVGNTVDNLGVCTCKKDFVIQKNTSFYKCLPVITNMEDTCQKNIQCLVHFGNLAHCFAGKCGCTEGSHNINNKCYESVRLNGTCQVNENCLLKDNQLAFCMDGRCQCDYITKHPYVDVTGQSCELNRYLGQNCTNNGECSLTAHSRCVGVCKCKPGFTTNYQKTSCMTAAVNIGDTCATDDQCDGIDEAICETGKCICRRGFHAYNNICYKDVALRSSCQKAAECVIRPDLQNPIKLKISHFVDTFHIMLTHVEHCVKLVNAIANGTLAIGEHAQESFRSSRGRRRDVFNTTSTLV
ncbi:uncharacterized protein CBL_07187 [Carabus blaptoides fortunei]